MKYSELGNLIKIQKGKKLEEVPNIKKSAIRYIQIGDLRTDENLKYTLNEGNAVLCNSQDILIAWDGANAGTVSFGLEGAIGSTLAKLTLSKEYYPPFVGRFLQSKFEYLQSTCTGATIPHISKAALLKILIPKISIAEQKRIADLLDKADALRKKNQELLAAYDELLKATFLELFGDPVTNPKGWEKKQLSEVCYKITDGTHQSPNFLSEGIPFIFVSNLTNKDIDYKTDKHISIEEYKILTKSTPIEIGDVLYSTVGSYGNPAIVKKSTPFCFQRHIAHLKPKQELVSSRYLYGYLCTPQIKQQADKYARGAAQKTINLKDLKSLEICIPPIPEQNKFSQIVENIELQKTIVKQSLQESEDLFNALVQKAFNGELA